MGIRHVRAVRADWQRALTEGLARAVEGLFLLTLVALPLDVYLELPDGRAIGFLSQALTVEMCALFGVALAASARLRRPTPLWPRLRELAPLGAALLAALASVILATSRSVALKESLKVFVYLGIFMVARAMLTRPRARYHALLALLVGATVVLIVGFFSAAPGSPDIAGVVLNIQRTSAALPGSETTRVAATFRYPNELAAYLVIIIPLLTACAVTIRDTTERVGYGLLVFAAGSLLLLTYTRGALLGVAVALLVLLWALGGRRLGLAGLAIMVCCGLALAFIPGPISARLVTAVTGSDGWQVFRLNAWRWAGSIFLHHPLVGVGIGNISLQPNAPLVGGVPEVDAESLILNVLAEMGILGGLAVGLCFYAGIRLALTGLRGSRGWLDRSWNAGALAALIGALVYGFSDPVLVSGQVTGLLCALVGLAGVAAPIRLGSPPAAPSAPDDAVRAPQAPALVPVLEPRRVPAMVPVLEPERVPALVPVLEPEPDWDSEWESEWESDWESESEPASEPASEPELEPALALRRMVFLLNARDLGGAEMHTINMADELRKMGRDTLVIIPPHARVEDLLRERGLPYRVERLGMNVGRWKGALGTLAFSNPLSRRRERRIISALADEKPSVFICPYPREQALLAAMKRRQPLQIVWVIHAPLHYLLHRLVVRPLLRALSPRVDLIVTISHTLARSLAEERYADERLIVIPNAVAVTPGSATPLRTRPRATLGFAGRLVASKGVNHLIEAVAEIRRYWPDVILLIAGTGPEEPALRRQVEQLDLGFNVAFLGDVRDMAAFYRRLTVFVLPTIEREGLPTVIIEAQNAGTPVVASAVEGVTELIFDEVNGLLAWPGDVHALADSILALLNHPDLARRLALTGWRQMRAQYALDRAAARFADAVASLGQPFASSLSWQTESLTLRVAHRSQFLRDTGLLLGGKLLTALATALWTVLAARSLPPSTYGDLMLVAGMVDIAAVITDAGLTASATQELAMATPRQAQQLAGTVLWLKLGLGAIAAGVAMGALLALPFTPEARGMMLLLAPGLLFISLTSLSLLFRARMETGYTVIPALLGAIAGIYGAVSVYLSAPSGDGFVRARLLMLVVSGALTLALIALRYRPRWNFDWVAAKRLLGASALLGLALALNILYYRIDVPLLALLAGSRTVATYTSAYRVLDVATLLPVTAATAALPLLSAQRSKRSLSAFVSQYFELALVVGLLIAVALTSAAQPVLAALYGDRYDSADPTLVALAWVAGMTLLTNVFSPLAVALNKRRLLMVVSGVALLANVALNLLLIPFLGSLGAALATLATEVVVTAPLAWACSREVRIRPRVRPVLAALVATAAWLAAQLYFGRALGHGWLLALELTVVWLGMFALLAPGWVMDVARTMRLGARRMSAPATLDTPAGDEPPPEEPVPVTVGEGRV